MKMTVNDKLEAVAFISSYLGSDWIFITREESILWETAYSDCTQAWVELDFNTGAVEITTTVYQDDDGNNHYKRVKDIPEVCVLATELLSIDVAVSIDSCGYISEAKDRKALREKLKGKASTAVH